MRKSPRLLLFDKFPRLRERLPVVALGTYPTPIERLPIDSPAELRVKRDDLSGEPWGTSKVRKLELYFGDALARGGRRVATVGPLGSNHALATAIYGHELGLEVLLELWPEPVMPKVRETVLVERALGARLTLHGTADETALARLAEASRADAGAETYFIPPAGTDPVGTLGYVECGLEIGAQVARCETPAPDFVHVAGGTGGVAAGLAIGLALAGLGPATQVVATRAVSAEVLHDPRVLILTHRTWLRLLDLAGAEALAPFREPGRDAFRVLHAHAGAGYGVATDEAERARRLFREAAGIELDPTYTAKAAAGLLAFAASPEGRGRRHLFLQTYGSRDLSAVAAQATVRDLPVEFQRLVGG